MDFALSKHLSFHARGDDVYVWHGLTGDVAQMSRDVLALLLAFDPPRDPKGVMAAPPAGLPSALAEEFVTTLRARRYLVSAGTDETASLLIGIPYVPRGAVFTRRMEDGKPAITIYGRGTRLVLGARTAALFDRCDGERTLGQVLADAGPAALPELMRLARADVAALKILAKPVTRGGLTLQPAAESTMPYAEIADPRGFAAGAADISITPKATAGDEPSLAGLFREPHPALHGKSFGHALALGLVARGAKATGARIVEVAGSRGAVGAELQKALSATMVPAAPGAADIFIANEVAGALGTAPEAEGSQRLVNRGALALVREAARTLAPGGVLYLSEFGELTADPVKSDHVDREEWSLRFLDLQEEAKAQGLSAKVISVPELVGLDTDAQALSTTRASFAALRRLFADNGLDLTMRAWLRTEVEALAAGKLDLREVHGLLYAPLGERVMGLSPRQFWALIATKPN